MLVLKEGWDVRNVTTIVGLRAYIAAANILPEQTLGRGLRRMFPTDDVAEELSVVGTDTFMNFVETITQEGVTLERKAMGPSSVPATLLIEVDTNNPAKDITALDIEIPVLTPRYSRNYARMKALDSKTFGHVKIPYQQFDDADTRRIDFVYTVTGEKSHETVLSSSDLSDYRQVLRFFSHAVMKQLRLVAVYDVVYEKMKIFIRDDLFEHPVDLEDRNTLCNLSDPGVIQKIMEIFKKEINALTVQDKGAAEISRSIRVSAMRPFRAKEQGYILPRKSVVNKIIADGSLELEFAEFLERCDDIISYVKNYFAVGFHLDYVKADGDLSNYYPDFLVKKSASEIYVVETKGLVDVDVSSKMARLKQWCEDLSQTQGNNAKRKIVYDFVYVDEESFKQYPPRSFLSLLGTFRRYKDSARPRMIPPHTV